MGRVVSMATVRVFESSRVREAAEHICKTQSYYMFRTADFKNKWDKWLFTPQKVISWSVDTLEAYLNTFMNVNSQYGHPIESFRIVVKPVRWFIQNAETGKQDYYDDLNEMLFLEGVDTWTELQRLGAGYEVVETQEEVPQRREYSIDELLDEL